MCTVPAEQIVPDSQPKDLEIASLQKQIRNLFESHEI